MEGRAAADAIEDALSLQQPCSQDKVPERVGPSPRALPPASFCACGWPAARELVLLTYSINTY